MKKTNYDFLIVGAGVFGCAFAERAIAHNKKVLIIEKRNHIGGNIYCENIDGIIVHKYGPHIFHTNNQEVFDYINQFTKFNDYIHTPMANFKGKIFNLPFNMNTFSQMWGVSEVEEAKEIIDKQVAKENIVTPKNLEEKALSLVGRDIYETLVKGYTEKQWGKKATELPAFIISRLPFRFSYNNNYFDDKFQGMPIGGYNPMIEKMVEGADILLNQNFADNKAEFQNIADKIIYTGAIDEYFDYSLGELEYRSLRFEESVLDVEKFQEVSVVNYTDFETPFTRIIEHKHFENTDSSKTVITKEYPQAWKLGEERFYSINDERNNLLYQKYSQLAKSKDNLIFGGRLGKYKYFDIDDAIESALRLAKDIL